MININNLLEGRWWAIWYRNLLVWKKFALSSLMAGFAEPLFYLLGLGYGLGNFINFTNEIPYIVFLASGIICANVMQVATFEGLYSCYTRMEPQQTWQGMLAAPFDMQDIVIGETCWIATKSFISFIAVLLVTIVLNIVANWKVLWILPIILLTGFTFGTLALIMTAFARSYDFFLYYVTLFITPMMLLSGVFFPFDTLPAMIQTGVYFFPLIHVIELVRPLIIGQTPTHIIVHLAVLSLYAIVAIHIAIFLLKKRLMA